MVLPVSMPAADFRLDLKPLLTAWDMTSKTAGPGVRQRRNSVMAKSSNNLSDTRTPKELSTVLDASDERATSLAGLDVHERTLVGSYQVFWTVV